MSDVESTALALAQDNQLLALAVEKNLDVDKLAKLIDLANAERAKQAERAFSAALAAFQAECPTIGKTGKANVTSGGGFSYSYAEFDEIVRVVRPIMARHGLSFTFDTTLDGERLTATCTLRHAEGHAVTSTFAVPTTTRAGMSDQQKVGAARTFANRYALLNVLGIATGEPDTDAADPATITEAQGNELETLLASTGSDRAKFLAYFNASAVGKLRAADFARAKALLVRKGKA